MHSKPGVYCSRICANSRGPRSVEFKKNVSKKLTGRIGHPGKTGPRCGTYENRACAHCSSMFVASIRGNKKYCSKMCSSYYIGGYRKGSGRAKSGYYNGIYCGSTYELCWVIYSLDHGIEFTRFNGALENGNLKYYPDFLLNDGKTIIETKGFEKQESVDNKTKLAESFGYTVKVLRKDDLQVMFDYVKEKYSTTEYYTLYDGFAPAYNYVCSHCSTDFSKNKKLKTDIVFCSRTCAGKGHKGRKVLSL